MRPSILSLDNGTTFLSDQMVLAQPLLSNREVLNLKSPFLQGGDVQHKTASSGVGPVLIEGVLRARIPQSFEIDPRKIA